MGLGLYHLNVSEDQNYGFAELDSQGGEPAQRSLESRGDKIGQI